MIVINGKMINRIKTLFLTDNGGYVIYDDEYWNEAVLTFTMDEVDEITL